MDVARDALFEKSSFGVNLNDDRKAAIAEILRLGTSAGGQRAKAIIDEVCEAASGWAALARECEVPVPMEEGILPTMLLDI